MMLSHSLLVIGMVLFPDLTQLDQTGSYEVFRRMLATHVHLLTEMQGPVRASLALALRQIGFGPAICHWMSYTFPAA